MKTMKTLILTSLLALAVLAVPGVAADDHEEDCEDRKITEWEASLDCTTTGSTDGAVDLSDSTGRLLNGFLVIGIDASCFLAGVC